MSDRSEEETNINKDKQLFNDLLSRLDTLHDFCDPNATRNKDSSIDATDTGARKKEFHDVFKVGILKTLNAMNDISKQTLLQAFNKKKDEGGIIESYAHPQLAEFYKQDLKNLMDRVSNNLIVANNLIDIDKETYNITKKRLERFEPSSMAFFELLYGLKNEHLQTDKHSHIGRFITNPYLPTFDYMNNLTKIVRKDPQEYTTTPLVSHDVDYLRGFLDRCIERQEQIVQFILGTDDHESPSGFFAPNDDLKYQRYLKQIREILGKYYGVSDDKTIYLIVDTTKISFSRYYEYATKPGATKPDDIKLKVLCNVAMNWDGANSPVCQKETNLEQTTNLEHAKINVDRAIYEIRDLHLQEKIEGTKLKTTAKIDETVYDSDSLPREVSALSECVRQNLSSKRRQTAKCSGITAKKSLDIKRTGDALQVLMTQKLLKDPQEDTGYYIFVTLDILAFLKARLSGVPALFTSFFYDEKKGNSDDDKNAIKVMTLYRPSFEVNLEALVTEFTMEKKKFTLLYNVFEINDNISKAIETLLIYHIKVFFGLEIVKDNQDDLDDPMVSAEESFLEDETMTSETSEVESVTMETDDNQLYSQQLKEFISRLIGKPVEYQSESITSSLLFKLYTTFTARLKETVSGVNKSIKECIDKLKDLCNQKLPKYDKKLEELDTFLDVVDVVDVEKIQYCVTKYVISAFIIECFYVLRRILALQQFGDDCTQHNIPDIIRFTTDQITKEDAVAVEQLKTHTTSLRFLNKKYDDFVGEIDGQSDGQHQVISAILGGLADRKSVMFGFDYNEYVQNFVESFMQKIESIHEKEIKTRLGVWEMKFNKDGYFTEPRRVSRHSPSIETKLDEFVSYFTEEHQFKAIVGELLHSPLHTYCCEFYKTRLAYLPMGLISKKAYDYDEVVEKMFTDVVITYELAQGSQPGSVYHSATSSFGSTVSNGRNDPHEGGTNKAEVIDDFFTLLHWEDMYYKMKDNGVEFDINVLTYKDVLLNYEGFVRDMLTENGFAFDGYIMDNNTKEDVIEEHMHLIEVPNIDEWRIPPSLEAMISFVKKNLEGPSHTLTNIKGIHKLTDDEKQQQMEKENQDIIHRCIQIRGFVSYLICNVFKMFQERIVSFYATNTEHTSGDTAYMIMWMMINNPTTLLYHPSRNAEWSITEYSMLRLSPTVMNGGVLPRGADQGTPQRNPQGNPQGNPTGLTLTGVGIQMKTKPPPQHKAQVQPFALRSALRNLPVESGSDGNPPVRRFQIPLSSTSSPQQNYAFNVDQSQGVSQGVSQGPSEVPDQIEHNPQLDYSSTDIDDDMLDIKKENIWTTDEYIDLCFTFLQDAKERMPFLLEANLYILTELTNDGNPDEPYTPRESEHGYDMSITAPASPSSSQNSFSPQGSPPGTPMSQGNVSMIGGRTMTLAQYHKKYYPPYHDMYHS